MEWIVSLIASGGRAGGLAYFRARRVARAGRALEVERVRQLAEDDVTHFGEQLTRFGTTLDGATLDDATHHDYQSALDAYEKAKTAAPRIAAPEGISAIVDTLTDGRYALACVQARLAGQPVPERRVPCFFDPRHGPSTGDFLWTPPGRGTRKVPACAQDAARIAAGAEPEVYYIKYGELNVPYWEAGAPGESYKLGFFGATGVRAMSIGLRMQNKGIDVGRGRRDPTIVRRSDAD